MKGKLNEEKLKRYFEHHADIQFPTVEQAKQSDKITAFYCEGMVDMTQYNEYFAHVYHYIMTGGQSLSDTELPPMQTVDSMEKMVHILLSGNLVFYKEKATNFLIVDISKVPQRQPSESNTEISIKGPKDAFTEEISINVSLIRKRLKTSELYNEQFQIGTISPTKVSLLYLANKANPDMIKEVCHRLETFQIESLVSSGQLEQWISDRTFTLFPLFDYIGRPDFVIECLLRGRFVLIIDGSPMVLIGPINVFELLKSPEDIHFPYHFVIFQRGLRFLGLLFAIFVPGFWIALSSVNIDQIPFSLLATVVTSREGLPIPVVLEALLLLGLFELLREAGIRLPKAVGQTIGIVGGIIIGDAVIRAGLASPIMLVVMAISAVSTFALVNQSLTGTVSILRIVTILVSALLGIYGFFLSMFGIFIYLTRLESFGMAYLEPMSSLQVKEFLSALVMNPFKRKKYSANILKKRKG
ncbi:spore germination protein [Ammoniphilus sp. YIM 78166]|uniref:spore germination protein n=1 Tax=Ammoniphilus sp. YIM 78166 TaxID=1644106 RepID=UPI00107030D3|nr:spore germination protein [Ammoniphilus sp. YIM 78166]